MANTSAIQQQAAHTTYHLLDAQQEPYKKSLTLNKKYLRVFWKEKKKKRQKKQERR